MLLNYAFIISCYLFYCKCFIVKKFALKSIAFSLYRTLSQKNRLIPSNHPKKSPSQNVMRISSYFYCISGSSGSHPMLIQQNIFFRLKIRQICSGHPVLLHQRNIHFFASIPIGITHILFNLPIIPFPLFQG